MGFAVAACICAQVGCLEMVKRPQEQAANDWLTDDEAASVYPPGSPESGAARQDTAQVLGTSVAAPRGVPGAVVLPKGAPERIRRVNEYSLWCIKQGMWKEAQSHMERVLERDSLSASLHNNLAIVYEHFGASDSAAAFYQRALELGGKVLQYQHNLDRLERYQDAVGDSTQTIDLFELKKRVPGPQQAPY